MAYNQKFIPHMKPHIIIVRMLKSVLHNLKASFTLGAYFSYETDHIS